MTQRVGPLVVIDWVDSCSNGGVWHSADEVRSSEPSACRSVGWVVREDRRALVLASHLSPHQMSGDMCIPKKAITRRRRIAGK